MSKQEKFIPMPEANTERFRAGIALPFGVENKIGINTKHIQTLSQIGGIRHVKLTKEDDFKVTGISNMVVGIDKNGAAISGGGVTSKVPTYDIEQHSAGNHNFLFKNTDWRDLDIKINVEEVKQRMLANNEDVRNARMWALEINEALTKGIVRAGMSNLLTNLSIMQFSYSILMYSDVFKEMMLGDFTAAARRLAATAGVFSILGPVAAGGFEDFKKGSGYRASAFINVELDRAIALGVASMLQPLAKMIESED